MTTGSPSQSPLNTVIRESLDGSAAGDHDILYIFDRLPHAASPFPFSMHQFARLLIVRGRLRAGEFANDDVYCGSVHRGV